MQGVDLNRIDTWQPYKKGMCEQCEAWCCRLPVEVRLPDLLRLGLASEFEADEPLKGIAKRLMKAGIVAHFNHRDGVFTLVQHSSGDCVYLDRRTRRCTVYEQRPETCRQHPQKGPRPGYCAWQKKGRQTVP